MSAHPGADSEASALRHWLAEAGVPFVLVFTKSDAVSQSKLARHMELFRAEMATRFEQVPELYATSAHNGEGRKTLLRLIRELTNESSDLP